MTNCLIHIDLTLKLIDDFLDDELLGRLRNLGEVLLSDAQPSADRLAADVVLTGWGSRPLPEHLATVDRLRFVMHSAGTIRPFVPKSLIGDGVRVSQSAAAMARSVAELALYFTLTLLRSLNQVDRAMAHAHDWHRAAAFAPGRTIHSATIGVIGASRVGRAYIAIVRNLGARVNVYDPYLSPEDATALGVRTVSLEELLSTSDVVANHAPVTPETRELLSADRLAMLRDGAAFVNTGRSAIVDSSALEAELRSGRISAGLDVFDREPLDPGSPLWSLPNVMLSPHIGATTRESFLHQGRLSVEEIERFLRGAPLQHEVTVDAYDRLA